MIPGIIRRHFDDFVMQLEQAGLRGVTVAVTIAPRANDMRSVINPYLSVELPPATGALLAVEAELVELRGKLAMLDPSNQSSNNKA